MYTAPKKLNNQVEVLNEKNLWTKPTCIVARLDQMQQFDGL